MKKKSVMICLVFGCSALLTSCAFRQDSDTPIMTQLQMREIQSRELDTSDKNLVMKSMMNVLQDDGYIIKNAVMEVGLLSAEKNIDVEDKATVFFARAFGPPNARWSKQQIREVSANVSEFGKKTRVRINFQVRTIDNFGLPVNVETLKDPVFYQDFFSKVSKALFIQEQDI